MKSLLSVPGVKQCIHAQSLQSCWTLCDPMDCSLPGSSVHESLQARILEWVAMPSSRGILPTQGLNLGLLHWTLPLSQRGSPLGWSRERGKSEDTGIILVASSLSKCTRTFTELLR